MRLSPFPPHCSSVKSKHTFLLLEILIAILLVSLCLIPLIQSPIQSYRAEMKLLEEMEGERLAEWSFSEVKDKLLKNEIPWDKIPSLTEKSAPIDLPPITIQIPGSKPKKIERSFVLRCGKKGEKEGLKGEIYRMMHVDIMFTPRLSQKKQKKDKRDYSYRLMVRKLPKEAHNTNK